MMGRIKVMRMLTNEQSLMIGHIKGEGPVVVVVPLVPFWLVLMSRLGTVM